MTFRFLLPAPLKHALVQACIKRAARQEMRQDAEKSLQEVLGKLHRHPQGGTEKFSLEQRWYTERHSELLREIVDDTQHRLHLAGYGTDRPTSLQLYVRYSPK